MKISHYDSIIDLNQRIITTLVGSALQGRDGSYQNTSQCHTHNSFIKEWSALNIYKQYPKDDENVHSLW